MKRFVDVKHMLIDLKPEFRPILFPIFCHFYLDLIQKGFKEAGEQLHILQTSWSNICINST